MKKFSYTTGRNWEDLNKHIQQASEKLYFCGHTIRECIDRDLFYKLTEFASGGFCYEFSVIGMMLLKGIYGHTRLTQGIFTREDGERGSHCFVQIMYHDERIGDAHDFILDFGWLVPFAIKQNEWPDFDRFQPMWHLDHWQFWSMPETQKLYTAMRRPATSNVFWELAFFRPDDTGRALAEKHGLTKSPEFYQIALDEPKFGREFKRIPTPNGDFITKKVVEELMREPVLPREEG